MGDFLDFMKFAGIGGISGDESLGKRVESFTDQVISLLSEIRDNTAAIRAAVEVKENGN